MNSSKNGTMITLFASMGQGKNHYSVSSIDKIRLNLDKFHDINIKRRWMFQCMADLEADKYIRRKPRYIQDHNGLIRQIPSMITFTLKGIVWLVKMGVEGAKKIYKSMMSYLKKDDKRFPSRTDFDDGSWWPEDPEDRKRVEKLLGIATKGPG